MAGATLEHELPAYAVRARNLAAASENRIHDDEVARRLGFAGGLVAGITTYAYMTRPVAEALGRGWLEAGTMAARFHEPVYDGDLVTVRGWVTEASEAGEHDPRVRLSVENEAGSVCATGEATLPSDGAKPPRPEDYADAPLPAPRPEATRDHFESARVLGTVRRTFRAERAGEFLDAVDDDLPLYRDGAVAHPGWIVYDANQILARNVALGPWIHLATEARHFSVVTGEEVVSTRGRVAAVFERKGYEFVELDLLVVAGEEAPRPVWHLRHTAIYRIAGS